MKPIKLEIDGLNSFETKQVLDFSALSNRDLSVRKLLKVRRRERGGIDSPHALVTELS